VTNDNSLKAKTTTTAGKKKTATRHTRESVKVSHGCEIAAAAKCVCGVREEKQVYMERERERQR
jgi:hypothetical protein